VDLGMTPLLHVRDRACRNQTENKYDQNRTFPLAF